MAEMMFSYFVVEHNLSAAIAGPFSSLASHNVPGYYHSKGNDVRADEDNDSDALPRRGEDCPYYRSMSVLESRRSSSDESRHRNTDKRLTVLARQTQITRVYLFCYKSA